MDDQQTDDQKNGEPAAPEQPAAEQRGSEGLNPWSLLAVLAVFAVGVVLIINWHWRRGSVVIGASVTLAGVLRLLLPPHRSTPERAGSSVPSVLFSSSFSSLVSLYFSRFFLLF